LAIAGEDKQHCPLARAEYATRILFVDAAGLGRVTRMRMQPNPGELLRFSACVHLGREEVGHSQIVKRDAGYGCFLLDAYEVLDPQEVVGPGYPETVSGSVTVSSSRTE
jgi:hypothetical protein